MISSDIVDVYNTPVKKARINVSYRNIDRLIGKKIDHTVIKKVLNLLDIEIITENTESLILDIPTYRVDVKKEADVIEEILRIYGYNNVEISNHVNSTLAYPEKPDKEKLVNIVSDMLSANGFAEIMCNSLNPSSWYEQSEDFGKEKLVILANPLSSDLNAMRQTLLYGGLSSVMWNLNRQNSDLKFYEFGNVYFYSKPEESYPKVENFTEKRSLDLFISGNTNRQSWNSKTNPTDFYIIKSYVEMVLSRLGIKPEEMTNGETGRKYFAESVSYKHNNQVIAETGRVAKNELAKFDINQDVYYAHLEWDMILKLIRNHSISFHELPKYPSVRRDLALLLSREVKFSQIRDLALRTEKNILHEVNLFDVYESDSLGKNKKSYAVSFVLRDELKTLTDKNIDKVMQNLIKIFEKELNAQIR
jgi:phenylalanyl-tRNA synthetase beta chain